MFASGAVEVEHCMRGGRTGRCVWGMVGSVVCGEEGGMGQRRGWRRNEWGEGKEGHVGEASESSKLERQLCVAVR